MMINALGLIEVIGYPTVIEAADAALKAANVQLGGIVKVDGGIMTAQILGDVGAVKAAVDAGGMAAAKVGTVRATHVIPRVDESLFGTVIKLRGKGTEEKVPKPASSSIPVPIKEEANLDRPVAEEEVEGIDELQGLEGTAPVEEVEDEWINPKDDTTTLIPPVGGTKATKKEWQNMSNKELRELITSLGIKVAEKKLKSAKKEDLIGIVKDFYKE